MYSKKVLTCIGSLQICSQHNQYDLYWNFCWFQIRQLWKSQQLLIALIYENVILWPWQVAVHFFNEYLVLRTLNSMLSLEAHPLAFLSCVLDLTYGCMADIWLKFREKTWQRSHVFFHVTILLEFISTHICQILVNSSF